MRSQTLTVGQSITQTSQGVKVTQFRQKVQQSGTETRVVEERKSHERALPVVTEQRGSPRRLDMSQSEAPLLPHEFYEI